MWCFLWKDSWRVEKWQTKRNCAIFSVGLRHYSMGEKGVAIADCMNYCLFLSLYKGYQLRQTRCYLSRGVSRSISQRGWEVSISSKLLSLLARTDMATQVETIFFGKKCIFIWWRPEKVAKFLEFYFLNSARSGNEFQFCPVQFIFWKISIWCWIPFIR